MSMTGPGETSTGTASLSDIKRALLDAKLTRQRAEAAERNRIAPVPRTGRLQVSDQQRHLWTLHQLAPGQPVYNVPFVLRLRGTLDTEALAGALRALVARHEALRTRFGSEHGVPYQSVDDAPAAWPLPVTDLSHLPGAERDDRARTLVETHARAPFDLENGPVFRTHLLRLAADEHLLVLCLHHIVTDGWSVGIVTQELAALYGSADASLPGLAVQPADHAAWQRRRLSGDGLRTQIDYWRTTLAGVPAIDFPTDRPRPSQPTWNGAELELDLPAELGAALRAWVREERVSLLAVLQAAFLTVLSRYTGEDDLAVGSVFSGRTRTEVEPLVGFFANTLVLRTSTAGDPAFRELVARCQRTVLGAMEHQDVPFGTLVEELRPERTPGRNPLFQISFTLLTGAMVGEFGLGDLAVEPVPVENGTARFDLAFQVDEATDGRLRVWLEYSTELFDRGRMERLVGHFRSVLEQAVAAPDTRVSALTLLTAGERERLLTGWNPPPVAREEDRLLLHELVERWARTDGSAPAVRFEGAELSYGELDAAANRLAHVLRADFGVGPDAVVGVLLDRGPELPVGQLATLKAGGAWLPLDPQHPTERLASYLSDARAAVVVTTGALAPALPADVPRLILDDPELRERLARTPETPLTGTTEPDHLAYIIYTSGSTGAPKGVMVSHRAAVNFVLNARELFRIGPGDRLLQFANPAFDVSVFDFYGALGSGAAVVGASRETLLDPDALQDLLARERVSVADVPPAVLRLLDPGPLSDLRALFVGLEAFPAELVNRWSNEGREFHNGYGPTEATVACVDYLCPPGGLVTSPPIGRAMANHRAYVLNAETFELVPVGVPGELFVAGAGLARGYLNRPDLTAERFVPDPFAGSGERMYRTGDVVRWREDGNLEFLGRADRQIKIRGLRIEPGEIEHALTTSPGVAQAVVTVDRPGTPEARLIAYAVAEAARSLDADALRTGLMDRLPQHMVPAQLMVLDALPLTPNGKVDHARLPAPQEGAARVHVAPRDATERDLAEIWHGLLDVPLESIGAYDSFFDLGGNSLQATRLISRIRDTFHTALEPRVLFAQPVLKDLAARIGEELATAAAEETDLEAEIAGLSEEELDRLLSEEA
ncbi:amino acid adenylation domain-containing protein [Streptomyces sp. HU2014]|uniref:non-ribosomal peptide synthetase n=1 Tax=Streptomyces sp. HU2014 TaxID=2939414 RepID=UPI00200D66C9|nr:amino acid adenylation domain-containing protein [Streptomyces sp. HU2014]UQI45639.1 amino acid adenylation domain-containing protein [Streptomyces sp. HU2014]